MPNKHTRAFSRTTVIFILLLTITATLPATADEQQRIVLSEAINAAKQWVSNPADKRPITGFSPAASIEMRTYDTPRPLRMWIANIDLNAPGVRMTTTKPIAKEGRTKQEETRCANTLEFARQRGVQLAINASAFSPFRSHMGEPMDLVGLAAESGVIYSETDKRFGAMHISQSGNVSLSGPPLTQKDLWQVIPGFRMLLDDGHVAVTEAEANSSFGNLNPRTALGVDKTGRQLRIIVVDGREPGISEGITTIELACLFASLGTWDALNLDGGGSSTFVLESFDGTHHVMNRPGAKDGHIKLRQVANNIGFYLPGSKPKLRDEHHLAPLRDMIISLASSRRGGGYKWKGDGVTRDISYDGTSFLKANPLGTFCCAATLELFLDAYCMNRYGKYCSKMNGRWFEDLPLEKLAAIQKGWWGTEDALTNEFIPERARNTIREKQVYSALPMTGLAESIDDYRLLQRGDMVMFWRQNGSGHSVVYWKRDYDDSGKERLWYWSSQPKPRYAYPTVPEGQPTTTPGYGLNWEYIGEEINPARIYGARIMEKPAD